MLNVAVVEVVPLVVDVVVPVVVDVVRVMLVVVVVLLVVDVVLVVLVVVVFLLVVGAAVQPFESWHSLSGSPQLVFRHTVQLQLHSFLHSVWQSGWLHGKTFLFLRT